MMLFTIRVYGGKNNKLLAEGLGRTKKQAETDAAFKAIASLKDPGDRSASPPRSPALSNSVHLACRTEGRSSSRECLEVN